MRGRLVTMASREIGWATPGRYAAVERRCNELALDTGIPWEMGEEADIPENAKLIEYVGTNTVTFGTIPRRRQHVETARD